MIQIFNPSWLRIKVNSVTQFAPIMVWQREKIPFFFRVVLCHTSDPICSGLGDCQLFPEYPAIHYVEGQGSSSWRSCRCLQRNKRWHSVTAVPCVSSLAFLHSRAACTIAKKAERQHPLLQKNDQTCNASCHLINWWDSVPSYRYSREDKLKGAHQNRFPSHGQHPSKRLTTAYQGSISDIILTSYRCHTNIQICTNSPHYFAFFVVVFHDVSKPPVSKSGEMTINGSTNCVTNNSQPAHFSHIIKN